MPSQAAQAPYVHATLWLLITQHLVKILEQDAVKLSCWALGLIDKPHSLVVLQDACARSGGRHPTN